jgi:hypothetical protein
MANRIFTIYGADDINFTGHKISRRGIQEKEMQPFCEAQVER